MRSLRFFGPALALLVWAAPASAQNRFDVQFFRPATSQRTNPLGMWSANVLPDGAFNVGLLGHYDHQPLVVRNEDSDILYSIVGHQSSLHVFGAFGLFTFPFFLLGFQAGFLGFTFSFFLGSKRSLFCRFLHFPINRRRRQSHVEWHPIIPGRQSF